MATVEVKTASELCPAPHLEASDLAGQDRVVTIRSWEFHEVGQEKERRGVLMFEEVSRGLVVNRTNLKRLIALYGNDLSDWKGKQVTLYPTETEYQGRTVPCIRVREKAAK